MRSRIRGSAPTKFSAYSAPLAVDVPNDLRKIYSGASVRIPSSGYQHISDVRIALGEIKDDTDARTLTQRTPGRPPWRTAWAISIAAALDGIYFVPRAGPDGKFAVHHLAFSTGAVNSVVPIDARVSMGMTGSPDRRSILYVEIDEAGRDLMLVDAFR